MTGWQGIALDNDLGAHAQAWDALNRAHFGNHPLLDSRFWNGLLRSFGHAGIQLWVLRDHAEVRAMCLLSYRSWGVWETFLPPQAQVGPVMIRNAAMVDALLAALHPLAVQLDLKCIDPAISDLRPSPGRATVVVPHALTMNVNAVGGHAAYWNRRGAGLRQNIRRYERMAERDGMQLRLQVTRDAESMAEAVRRYGALESRGWKGGSGTAITPGNAQSRFYTSIMAAFAATGQGAVHELWDGEHLVASRLMIESGATLVMLKTTYDESQARYALGWQLLSRSLQVAFDDPALQRVEFYTNASSAQLAWADSTRWIHHLSVVREGRLGRLLTRLQSLRHGVRGQTTSASPELSVERLPMSGPWPADVVALVGPGAMQAPAHLASSQDEEHGRIAVDQAERALHVLRCDGKAIAALPLQRRPGRMGQQFETPSSDSTATGSLVAAQELRAESLAVLFRHLMERHGMLSRFSIGPMDPRRVEFHIVQRALQLAGLVCAKSCQASIWQLRLGDTWEDYLEGRTADQRSVIERACSTLGDAGIRMEIVAEVANLDRGLAAYLQVSEAGQKTRGSRSGQTMRLARDAAEAGRLRLGLAWRGAQPIAAQIWLVDDGRAEIHQRVHDQAFEPLAPSSKLTAALLRHVMERDAVREVHDLIGDDATGQIWMSDRHEQWTIQAHHPLHPGELLGLRRRADRNRPRGLHQRQQRAAS